MTKFEELQQAPQERIDQAIRRKIRQYEDEALVALQIGDMRTAMDNAQKIEMISTLVEPMSPSDQMSNRRQRLRALLRS